jgi:CPA2 family monovalent cation:H+ antiporter-2
MGVDYRVIMEQAVWIALAVAGLLALKSVVIGLLCRLFGLPNHVAVETGLLLGQGGEFAFVVTSLAMNLGLVPVTLGQFVLVVTGLSMIATPLIAYLGRRLGNDLERRHEMVRQADGLKGVDALEGHVIIAGFGRVGQMMGRMLDRENVPFLALDTNAVAVSQKRAEGLPVYYGDASRIEMLRRARAETAAALVLTMDNPVANEHVLQVVHREWPNLPVFARARDKDHAARLLQHGASDVVPETLEATLQLGMRVMKGLGTSDEICMKRIDAERSAEMEGLKL